MEADAIRRGDGYLRWAGGLCFPILVPDQAGDAQGRTNVELRCRSSYGPLEFFDDAERLLDVITRLTDLHEHPRKDRWAVTDAPADFIKAQLRGIVGLRMPISRLDGKRKMSQNRNLADRAGVINGLSESHRPEDHIVASLIPQD